MLEIVKSGGWLMLPIILCSVISAAIILERIWTLQQRRVLPRNPLGEILAAGLSSRHRDREAMKEGIEDTGRHVVHELERYLNTLGTIAAVSPLLGLLGTVIGMVKVFAAITTHGVGDPAVLAGGISEALITTAAGLSVAIPSLIGYRYLRGRVDALVVQMEKEAITLVEALHRRLYLDTLGRPDESPQR
jgi:biopolymer transport protein ExbB